MIAILSVCLCQVYITTLLRKREIPSSFRQDIKSKKLRWQEINIMLDSVSKSKTEGIWGGVQASTPFSAITRDDVGGIFERYMRPLSLPDAILPDNHLDVLFKCVGSVMNLT